MSNSTTLIPHFITAKTKPALMQAMLNNNIKHGKKFNYFDLQKDGREWLAWYYDDLKDRAKNGALT